MRGYVSFLIVLAALFLFIHLLEHRMVVNSSSDDRIIAAERIYQDGMNIKEVVHETARQAAREGFLLYLASIAFDKKSFDLKAAKKAVRTHVYKKLSSLQLQRFFPDSEVLLWCSVTPVKPNVYNTMRLMSSTGKAEPCPTCVPLSDSCEEQLRVDIILTDELSASILIVDISAFGFSIYTPTYRIGTAGYFPQRIEVTA